MYPILAKQRKHIYKKYRHVTISNQRYIKHDKGKDTVIIKKKLTTHVNTHVILHIKYSAQLCNNFISYIPARIRYI